MKVPIGEVACIDLDAPLLSAYEPKYRGVMRWFVWCKHCHLQRAYPEIAARHGCPSGLEPPKDSASLLPSRAD